MKIICNGEPKEINQETSVEQLVESLGIDPDAVVAECDGLILKRQDYAQHILKEGSVLELIRFVGGG